MLEPDSPARTRPPHVPPEQRSRRSERGTENEAQARAAYDACKALVAPAARLGHGEYGSHLDFMDLVAEQYDFNGHAQRRFGETIKDALDPNGILSPGKQGIWPSAYRDAAR